MSKRTSLKGRGADVFLNETAPQEKQTTSIPVSQHTSKPVSQPTGKTVERLIKVTFYLPTDDVEVLDDFWMCMRKTVKKKITKSLIMSLLINKAFEGFRGKDDEKIAESLRLK